MRLHTNPLKTKIVGLLKLMAETPLHVGMGNEEVRKSFLRLPGDKLVIPSSTWKGAFRSLTERLVKSVELSGLAALATKLYSEGAGGVTYRGGGPFDSFVGEFVKVLQGKESDLIPYRPEELQSLVRELGYEAWEINEVKERGVSARDNLAYDMAEGCIALHCPVGKLYGNRAMAGKLRFIDSIMGSSGVEMRAGIGIDRASGKVRAGALYFMEIVPRGTTIKLVMLADNLVPGEDDSRLFASTLKVIDEFGISMGGRKSTGLGSLKLLDGTFYVVQLERDSNRLAIGNPLEKGEKLKLEEFVSWLRR